MSGMTVYFIRRLMLVPITFLAITFMVYAILRVVPGGPIEQAETQLKLAAAGGEAGGGGGGAGAGDETGLALDADAMEELLEYYALDRSIPVGYLQWLGLWPRIKKTRVPAVPLEPNRDAIKRLENAAKDVADAEDALRKHLAPRDLAAYDGRLWRTPAEGEVPSDVLRRAEELRARTFGEHHPLQAFLAEHGMAWVDGGVRVAAGPAEADAFHEEAGRLLAAAAKAREAQQAAEAETGYWLNDAGRPVQNEFRVLHRLNAVRNEATERLEDLLGPEHMIAYAGRVYALVPEETLEDPAHAEFFAEANELERGGYGKRDELLEHLGEAGYTWRDGKHYALLTPEQKQGREEMLETARALIAARRLANDKLAQVEEQQAFRITEAGRIYQLDSRLSGILQLDFGKSTSFNEPVLGLIGSRMEISIQFGLIGYFLVWLVCIPLGVFKAIKHRSLFDSTSSVVVFLGYSIPGFVLCLILLASVAPELGLPLGGYKPPNIEELGWWDSVMGRVRHMLIPVAGYMVTQFAAMTILMKNSLLENLSQDYVRTAFAKGLSEKRVIFVHALRNSLIPITAGIGHALGLLFAGSFLIEKACNIPGMGLLGFNAILRRDYPIILGLLVFLVLIRLTGNILSDIIWAVIDPRIRFGR